MKLSTKVVTLLAVCAMCVMPLGMASAATAHSSNAHGNSSSANAKAYGKVCLAKGLSKKHIKGEKGTLFSQCVTAMAHAAKSTSTTAARACSTMSKQHVTGVKGTPFTDCVAAAKVVKAKKS